MWGTADNGEKIPLIFFDRAVQKRDAVAGTFTSDSK